VEIEVLYFASLAERSGRRSETVSIDAEATVASLWRALEERHATLAALRFRPLAACDRAWVAWDAPLAGVREVAFVPPVSGG
jgi:molybdopterin synthase sulfur carrier subunit